MKLIPAALKSLAMLCSTDKTRPSLAGVRVHTLTDKQAQFEASDGNQAIRVTQLSSAVDPSDFPTLDGLHADRPDTDAIVPATAWKEMFTEVPKESQCRSLPLLRHVAYASHDHTVTVGTTDLEQRHLQTIAPIDGTFPNINAVMPTQPAALTLYVNVHLLTQVLTALSKMLPNGYSNGYNGANVVRLDLYGAEQPIRITAIDREAALHYTALVMPMRGDNIPLTPPMPAKKGKHHDRHHPPTGA